MKLLEQILISQDLAVFCYDPQYRFTSLVDLPAWFESLYQHAYKGLFVSSDNSINERGVTTYELAELFPFIAYFLGELDQNKNNKSGYSSELWTEEDALGHLYRLELQALVIDGQSILLIKNKNTIYDERHQVYQQARNILLHNETLRSELNQNQHFLQQEINKQLSQYHSINEIVSNIKHRKNNSAVFICGVAGETTIVNDELKYLYDQTQANDLLPKWINEAAQLYPEINQVLSQGRNWDGEFTTHNNNKNYLIRLSIESIHDERGHLAHYVCILNDLAGIAESEPNHLIPLDELTQLPSRLYFIKQIGRLLKKCDEYNRSLVLFYLNIDDFKKINIEMSHNTGDYLLRIVAHRLKEAVEESIFVTTHTELSHLGGDEFALILENVNDQDQIYNIATYLQNQVKKLITLDNNKPFSVTISIGTAIYPNHGANDADIIRHANMALYQAKRQGYNGYQLFSYTSLEKGQPLDIKQELFKVINNNYLNLVYQPQISCTNDYSLLKLEALMRWDHHIDQCATPNLLIPISEDTEAITALGNWVIEEACQTANELESNGIISKISVNISEKHLMSDNFVAHVLAILKHCNTKPQRIEFEISETVFIKEPSLAIDVLLELREQGITIILDDFSMKYASLSYLKTLPIDSLKINRYFIQNLHNNEESQTIVSAIINLGHQLDLDIIVEGVVTQTQFKYLKDKHCEYVQGALFFKPFFKDDLFKHVQEIINLKV